MARFGILLFALLIAAFCGSAPLSAQRGDFNIYDAVRIPRSLQPSLILRINSFVEAQHANQWDTVAEMLGPFGSAVTRSEYQPGEKEWVVQKLKARSLLTFRPKVLSFSTASIDLPFAKRWWYIEGEGEFNKPATEKVVIAAYRSNAEWYFQPMVVTDVGWEPLLKPASNTRLERTRRQ
ncbi:MAG TPA: hypothetical protein VLE19_12575 [Pyrinomonadaceae bacterium]|nr:hypothetical protein [Pyrinomonadaceae bacterium]